MSARKGISLSEEHKKKIGDANRGKTRSEEIRKVYSEVHKGSKLSEETKQKLSITHMGLKRTEEQKQNCKKAAVKRHASGVYEGVHKRHAKQEYRFLPVAQKLGYMSGIEEEFRITHNNKSKYPDFYNKETREIIELWGDYWHRNHNPQDLISWYKEAGWSCIVVWERNLDNFIKRFNNETDK